MCQTVSTGIDSSHQNPFHRHTGHTGVTEFVRGEDEQNIGCVLTQPEHFVLGLVTVSCVLKINNTIVAVHVPTIGIRDVDITMH